MPNPLANARLYLARAVRCSNEDGVEALARAIIAAQQGLYLLTVADPTGAAQALAYQQILAAQQPQEPK